MEDSDRELIKKFQESDAQLKRLYEQHKTLEARLARYHNMQFLTPKEQLHMKDLKKKKLSGVDRMMAIISTYRPPIREFAAG